MQRAVMRYVIVVALANGCGFSVHTTETKPTDSNPQPPIDAFVPDAFVPDAAPTCTYTDHAFGGHHYRYSTNQTWDTGRADCESDGGHLMKIETTAEDNDLTFSLIGQFVWIGAHDIGNDEYRWTDNTMLDYTNWVTGATTPTDPNKNCIVKSTTDTDGTWYVATCADVLLAICECDR